MKESDIIQQIMKSNASELPGFEAELFQRIETYNNKAMPGTAPIISKRFWIGFIVMLTVFFLTVSLAGIGGSIHSGPFSSSTEWFYLFPTEMLLFLFIPILIYFVTTVINRIYILRQTEAFTSIQFFL